MKSVPRSQHQTSSCRPASPANAIAIPLPLSRQRAPIRTRRKRRADIHARSNVPPRTAVQAIQPRQIVRYTPGAGGLAYPGHLILMHTDCTGTEADTAAGNHNLVNGIRLQTVRVVPSETPHQRARAQASEQFVALILFASLRLALRTPCPVLRQTSRPPANCRLSAFETKAWARHALLNVDVDSTRCDWRPPAHRGRTARCRYARRPHAA